MSSTNSTTPQGEKSFDIPNFTCLHKLKASTWYHPDPEIAALISLKYDSGPLSLQHSITPSGARQMAADLLELADFADALNLEAAVLMAEAGDKA